MHKDNVVSVLSGHDVDKFDYLLGKYPQFSRSGIVRFLIQAEYARLKLLEPKPVVDADFEVGE
jgi:hypothetical protein